jgi:hypothetical protein
VISHSEIAAAIETLTKAGLINWTPENKQGFGQGGPNGSINVGFHNCAFSEGVAPGMCLLFAACGNPGEPFGSAAMPVEIPAEKKTFFNRLYARVSKSGACQPGSTSAATAEGAEVKPSDALGLRSIFARYLGLRTLPKFEGQSRKRHR